MLIILGVFFVAVGFAITWLMSRRLTESTADNAALGQEIVERDERLAEAKLNAEYWRRKYEEVAIEDAEPEEITTELLPLEIEVVVEEPPTTVPKKTRRRAKKGK